MILVLIHSVYLIWYGTISPFISFKTTLIEGFNESLFMFLSYHLFVFTNYATGSFEEDVFVSVDIEDEVGYSYIGIVSILVLVNIVDVVINTVEAYKEKKRIHEMKKWRDAKAGVIRGILKHQEESYLRNTTAK